MKTGSHSVSESANLFIYLFIFFFFSENLADFYCSDFQLEYDLNALSKGIRNLLPF